MSEKVMEEWALNLSPFIVILLSQSAIIVLASFLLRSGDFLSSFFYIANFSTSLFTILNLVLWFLLLKPVFLAAFPETISSDSSTSGHSEEKEVSWITHESLFHQTSDAEGIL